MKIISLNIWMGKQFNELSQFIASQSHDMDVFCFQEVFHTTSEVKENKNGTRANLFSELQQLLPDHEGYFEPAYESNVGNFIEINDTPVGYHLAWGLAIFIRKGLDLISTNHLFVLGNKNSPATDNFRPTILQYANLKTSYGSVTIAHTHGLWVKGNKDDTPYRIEQSQKIKQVLDQVIGQKIFCGDLNLAMNTKSLAILEEGMVNLIKTFNITTTRSALYPKPEKYADYMIVSPDINVDHFEVPYTEASDHLPLVLTFS